MIDPSGLAAHDRLHRTPVPASGSCCRPMTRPRTSARWRRPSSRRCRRRRCSSSTTGRPTAPGGWPMPSRRPIRVSVSAIGRPSRASAAPTSMGSGWRSRAARRRSSRWTPTSATTRPSCQSSSRRSTTDAADLVIGSRYTTGGGVVDWGLGRRIVSRGGSIFARIVLGPRPERPDRRLQGVAGVDPGRGPVRRRPRRRLRVPDRDDVPGRPGRCADPRSPDHLPRPPRRPVAR